MRRSFKIKLHDDKSGRRYSNYEIPRIGDVVVVRMYHASDQMEIVTVPVMEWLQRNKVYDGGNGYETLQDRIERLAACD